MRASFAAPAALFALWSAVAAADNPLTPFPSPMTPPSAAPTNTSAFVSGACGTTNAIAFFSAASTLSCDANFTWNSGSSTLTFGVDTAVTLTGGVNGLNFASDTLSIDGANKRVGFGISAPLDTVHVVGDIRMQAPSNTVGPRVDFYVDTAFLGLIGPARTVGQYCANAAQNDFCYRAGNAKHLFSVDNGATNALSINGNNAIGINMDAPSVTGLTINAGQLIVDNGAVATPIATFKDNTATKWSIIDGGNLMPGTDNDVDIGSDTFRVKLVRAVTVTTGDLVLNGHEHGGAKWRLVEADDRIVVVNEDTGERFHMVMEAE